MGGGGGGGGGGGPVPNGGGGGGSGFVDAVVRTPVLERGTGKVPPQIADVAYKGGRAIGGAAAQNGGHGYVVIRWWP